MSLAILPLPGNEDAASQLARSLAADLVVPEMRAFPDGETYARVDADLSGRDVAIFATLGRPDAKFVPIAFLARLARDLGAARVGLVAPYLAYMRQDRRFRPGEAITSVYFAELLSSVVDWIVTVDPHLHRRDSLEEIYRVPSVAAPSSGLLAAWIREHVERPVLIGPDTESEQWVASVATDVGAPFTVLEKERRGDRDVQVSIPDPSRLQGLTPVLLDDMISTGQTMIATLRHLAALGLRSPVCVAIHAVFADGAYDDLRKAGAVRVVTANTIPHESNAIDVTPILSDAVRRAIVAK